MARRSHLPEVRAERITLRARLWTALVIRDFEGVIDEICEEDGWLLDKGLLYLKSRKQPGLERDCRSVTFECKSTYAGSWVNTTLFIHCDSSHQLVLLENGK